MICNFEPWQQGVQAETNRVVGYTSTGCYGGGICQWKKDDEKGFAVESLGIYSFD